MVSSTKVLQLQLNALMFSYQFTSTRVFYCYWSPADATDTNIKYLAGSDSQDKGMLKKGKYDFEDLSPGDYAQIVLPHRKLRVKRKDLVIDLPPKTDSLTVNTAVLIPVQRNEDSSKDECGSRQGELEQKNINGALMMVQDSGVVTIKALYTSKQIIASSLLVADADDEIKNFVL